MVFTPHWWLHLCTAWDISMIKHRKVSDIPGRWRQGLHMQGESVCTVCVRVCARGVRVQHLINKQNPCSYHTYYISATLHF